MRKALILAIAPILVVSVLVGRHIYREHRLSMGFEAITHGMSKEEVIDLMGEDYIFEQCTNKEDCVDDFLYSVLFKRWLVFFDSDGKVNGKVINEGSF